MRTSLMLEKTAHGEKNYGLISLFPVSINVSDHSSGFNFPKSARMIPRADSIFMLKELLSKHRAPLPASASEMCLWELWRKTEH